MKNNIPQPPKTLTPEIEQAMQSVIKFQDVKPVWGRGDDPQTHAPMYKYVDAIKGSIAPKAAPAVVSKEFRMLNGLVAPGQGAAFHHHTGEELMFAVTGTWVVYFDEEEKHKVILEPWDAILVPANVWRGWRNVGKEPGYFMNIGSAADIMTNLPKSEPEQSQPAASDDDDSDCAFS